MLALGGQEKTTIAITTAGRPVVSQHIGNLDDDDAFDAMPMLMPVRSWRTNDLAVPQRMIEAGLNTPRTSSVGRLLGGVAALIGLRQIISYGGQAAIELEASIGDLRTDKAYCFLVDRQDEGVEPLLIVDWRQAIRSFCDDVRNDTAPALLAAAFHNGLANAMIEIAQTIGEPRTALSGGCFQNRYLTEGAKAGLGAGRLPGYSHRNVPPNDGGLALGQIG